mmetsp:Transcript_127902/g.370152  ORF Transcript_127902/g.370152 Transcript_127902/m.370152 type:complete len:250 (-) Transcript_127902:123-872(-)
MRGQEVLCDGGRDDVADVLRPGHARRGYANGHARLRVEGGPAGIARIDRRIDLNDEHLVRADAFQQRVHILLGIDSGYDTLGDADRIASLWKPDNFHLRVQLRQDLFERCLGNVVENRRGTLNLKQSQVDVVRDADQFRRILFGLAVLAHPQQRGVINNVRIREHQFILADENSETTAGPFLLAEDLPWFCVTPLGPDAKDPEYTPCWQMLRPGGRPSHLLRRDATPGGHCKPAPDGLCLLKLAAHSAP